MTYVRTSHPLTHKYVPYNAKIADITHADTNHHTLDLTSVLSETREVVFIIVYRIRMAGGNELRFYPNGHASSYIRTSDDRIAMPVMVAAGTNLLEYSLGVANDDFDLYCVGYVVKG